MGTDDRQNLLDETRHAVRAGEIPHGKTGVDQMQGERYGLRGGQRGLQAVVDGGKQLLGQGEVLGVEVADLGLQGIGDGGAARDRTVDVVRDGHHEGELAAQCLRHVDAVHGVDDELHVLAGDAGNHGGEVIRVPPRVGDEDLDHLGRIHLSTRLGLETDAAAGDDDVLRTAPREHDVVVEHAQQLHETPSLLRSGSGESLSDTTKAGHDDRHRASLVSQSAHARDCVL